MKHGGIVALGLLAALTATVAPTALARPLPADAGPVSEPAAGLRRVVLPEPPGPYTPAARTFLFVDESRIGPPGHADATGRPLRITLWYPSDATSGTPRPYMHPELADAWRDTLPTADGFETAVEHPALDAAPLSRAQERWPVLLFSHGRSFPVDAYQLNLQSMASRGWVVAAMSHPGEEVLTLLPDGRRLPFAGPGWDDEGERGEVLSAVVDALVADARFVLDRLGGLDRDAPGFRGRLDLARGVGYYGHSLGGAAAARALQVDDRIVAAASWEGQVYRAEDRPLRTRRPLLYVIGGANRHELMGAHYRPALGGGTVFEVVLRGAWHASFGDLLHVYADHADADWLRRHRRALPALRANEVTDDLLDELFAHYLLGRELDLLWPDSGAELESYVTWTYPEVELRVYAP